MAHIRCWRQVSASPECPLVDGEQSQGCRRPKSVGSHRISVDRIVIKPQEASRGCGDSCCNSHRVVKPIVVTTNTSQARYSDSGSSSSQTPPLEYCQYFEWRSLMTTMGWITAKTTTNQWLLRVRARWTLHRKVRRCKRFGPAKNGSYSLVDGAEFNVNFPYGTTIRSREEEANQPINYHPEENHDHSNSVHKSKQNHQTIEHNLRTTVSDTSHAMDLSSYCPVAESKLSYPKFKRPKKSKNIECPRQRNSSGRDFRSRGILLIGIAFLVALSVPHPVLKTVEASLIIGDSAIEIQEIDPNDNINTNSNNNNNNNNNNINNINNNNDNVHFTTNNNNQENNGAMRPNENPPNELIFGSTGGIVGSLESQLHQQAEALQLQRDQPKRPSQSSAYQMPGPLPPIVGGGGSGGALEDITDGDQRSRDSHDFDIHELNDNDHDEDGKRLGDKDALKEVFSVPRPGGQSASSEATASSDKAIAGKVVDFELTPAGGHNKAKIKKKKKQAKEEEMFKKWGKKKKYENKSHEKKHKEMMKKKKEEGKKGKKKWGHEEHGLKKKGNFKKKKWAEKVKKGKGVKKGKKGKKFLKDVGHKNTGFKTVYHKEEWGKSSKWHDIKRQKKWDEKSKKWKKKWKKEKGKKYKGDHMKKFEKKKKSGKKYKKESKDKFKKFKKEKFEKGKKKKLEEKSKKKEGGAKKMMKEMKKKKKKS